MKKIMIAVFFALMLVSCGYDEYDKIDVEYTNEDGELGGRCFLPERICSHWPELYCDGWDFKCKKMPVYDSDTLLHD